MPGAVLIVSGGTSLASVLGVALVLCFVVAIFLHVLDAVEERPTLEVHVGFDGEYRCAGAYAGHIHRTPVAERVSARRGGGSRVCPMGIMMTFTERRPHRPR